MKTQKHKAIKRKNPVIEKRKKQSNREERSDSVNKIQMNNQRKLTRKILQIKKPRGRYASRLNLNVLIQYFKD